VLGGSALEALDPTAGVDKLLLARVEGVALGAQLDPEDVCSLAAYVYSIGK